MASGTDQGEGTHELTGHLYIDAVFWGVQQHTQMSFSKTWVSQELWMQKPGAFLLLFGGGVSPKTSDPFSPINQVVEQQNPLK